jgi:hypothetical protein
MDKGKNIYGAILFSLKKKENLSIMQTWMELENMMHIK